jgi:LysM domain
VDRSGVIVRTQVLHSDVDERSWHLPKVDPTGWLTRRSAAGGVGPSDPAANGDRPGAVQRRRPRRSEAARAARERELARRRRRRHGRAFVVDTQGSAASAVVGRSGRPVASVRRVADPAGRRHPAADATYRLGRWGRLGLTLLVAVTLALLIGRLFAGSMVGAATELVDVTVGPGDTLWSIASSAAPDRDPRAVIDQIRTLNDVPGDVVRVGEVLRVPTSAG